MLVRLNISADWPKIVKGVYWLCQVGYVALLLENGGNEMKELKKLSKRTNYMEQSLQSLEAYCNCGCNCLGCADSNSSAASSYGTRTGLSSSRSTAG